MMVEEMKQAEAEETKKSTNQIKNDLLSSWPNSKQMSFSGMNSSQNIDLLPIR